MNRTVKRPIPQFPSFESSLSKYFNQMTFKGIIQNNNPFDVDQLSFKNANNVYVDDNGTLISRPPIVVEALPTTYSVENGTATPYPILTPGYVLVDIFETGRIKVFITKHNGLYVLVAMNKSSYEIKRMTPVSDYHLTVIEQYIIAFNTTDARVLNIDQFDLGWQLLRDLSEVPVTKRIVGQETFTHPGNQFTESYKEEYVYSPELLSILPEGNAQVKVTQSPNNLEWTLLNANINTEFRILRTLNTKINPLDLLTVATNDATGITTIAIAKPDHVLLSFDDGYTFKRVLYPANDGYAQVASISKDALHFFFVARDGVYRYSIADEEWVVIRLGSSETLTGVGYNNVCSFNNEEVFSFILHDENLGLPTVDIYWKGTGLKSVTYADNTLGRTRLNNIINPSSKLTKANADCTQLSIKLDDGVASVVAWLPSQSALTTTLVSLRGSSTENLVLYLVECDKVYGSIRDFSISTYLITIDGITNTNTRWFETDITFGQNPDTSEQFLSFKYKLAIGADVTDHGAPIYLGTGYVLDKETYSVDGDALLPEELVGTTRTITVSDSINYYMVIDDLVYTNSIPTSTSVTITYNRPSNAPFTKLPTVSYASDELFLAFNNKLKITENIRDGANITFYLPKINDHAFSSDINAMLNISTTEVAIFLVNKIYVVNKAADEVFGYRYDYMNTRLSNGVRPGDSVINTLNGVFTLYPTVQGLAVMNYQPDVTNTDQVVEYVTKDVTQLWQEFYAVGPIKIVQMRDYVYLSNGSTTYLMLDLRTMSWWKLTSPVPVTKIVTDHFYFNIVSNGLYKYNYEHVTYKDLLSRDIEWLVESQPNHFGAPSHYKNLKQIIFQLEEATNSEQTIISQIKLYRKQLTLREPEDISFKVEQYRTFIKRFNYWKINEFQWALANDSQTATPAQLKLNGLTIKYEISEEVRS